MSRVTHFDRAVFGRCVGFSVEGRIGLHPPHVVSRITFRYDGDRAHWTLTSTEKITGCGTCRRSEVPSVEAALVGAGFVAGLTRESPTGAP